MQDRKQTPVTENVYTSTYSFACKKKMKKEREKGPYTTLPDVKSNAHRKIHYAP